MSVSKFKNLERKLDNFAKEAKNELNNVCGSSLWESLGFVILPRGLVQMDVSNVDPM